MRRRLVLIIMVFVLFLTNCAQSNESSIERRIQYVEHGLLAAPITGLAKPPAAWVRKVFCRVLRPGKIMVWPSLAAEPHRWAAENVRNTNASLKLLDET